MVYTPQCPPQVYLHSPPWLDTASRHHQLRLDMDCPSLAMCPSHLHTHRHLTHRFMYIIRKLGRGESEDSSLLKTRVFYIPFVTECFYF